MTTPDAENLHELPDNWCWATVQQIARQRLGKMLDKAKNVGKLRPYLRNANVRWFGFDLSDVAEMRVTDSEFSEVSVKSGDLVICEGGEPGRCAVWCDESRATAIQKALHRVRPYLDVSSSYLAFALATDAWSGKLARSFTGSTIKHFTGESLRSYLLPVAPVREQDRIVSAIESYLTRLDDAVASLERVQRNLKRYRASVLKAAVEGRLVPTEAELARSEGRDYEPASVLLERILKERRHRWIEDTAEKGRAKAREKARKAGKTWTKKDNAKTLEAERAKADKKYKEPAAPEIGDLSELPEGWCWATVESIADQRLGKMLDKAKNLGVLRPYLRNANVRWFGFDISDLAEMRVTEEEFSEVSVKAGDVVICEGGEPGRCAVWSNQTMSIAIQKALHRVRPYPGISSAYFAVTVAAEAQRSRLARAFTGSTIKHLTGEALRSFAIAVPPTHEQRRIVVEVENAFSLCDAVSTQVEHNLRRCQRLRQSILKWAFEGKLVDQDPDDEPASVLLERIQAERAAMEATDTKKKSRKRQSK